MDTDKNQQIPKSITKSTPFIILIFLTMFCILQNTKADEVSEQFIDKLANEGTNGDVGKDNVGKNEEKLARLKEAAKEEAEFRAKYRDMKEYVKLNDPLYGRTREMFNKDSLPLSYELLKDDDYASYWKSVAQVIAFISDDPNSVSVLLDYFQRDDGEKNFDMGGKIWSIAWIGKIGGKEADSILRRVITKEGARELAKAWINDELWQDKYFQNNKDRVIKNIQSAALQGLAFSKNQENLDFLEKLYNENFDISIKNNAPTDLMSPLVDAMAHKDYIADHGYDGYFAVWHSDDGRIMGPYIRKYSFLFKTMGLN